MRRSHALLVCVVATGVVASCTALHSPAAVGFAPDSLRAGVRIDRRHHRIVLLAGPYDLASHEARMSDMPGMRTAGPDAGMAGYFVWPFRAWFRGYRTEVLDATGQALPRKLLHHFTVVNFDRRMLLYPFLERLAGARLQSEDVSAPPSVGVPLDSGMRLGLYLMWHNATPRPVAGVFLRLTLLYLPSNEQPRPVDAFPVVLYANRDPRGDHMYDAPPGHSERSAVVRFPVAGHLLGVGGHLHDHGTLVRLEDATTGRTVVGLHARYDPAGELLGVSRRLYALRGLGLHIRAGRQYRLVAVYDNPLPDSLHDIMGELMCVFAPDDVREWPRLQTTDPEYLADLHAYGLSAPPDSLTTTARLLRHLP